MTKKTDLPPVKQGELEREFGEALEKAGKKLEGETPVTPDPATPAKARTQEADSEILRMVHLKGVEISPK